jgi:hypothetical protein
MGEIYSKESVMGQFKQIHAILQEIANDANVHPSVREAMRNTIQSQPIVEVYLLLCDGVVTDVFTDKAMAEYDLHICQLEDNEEGLAHDWTLLTRQLNTATL